MRITGLILAVAILVLGVGFNRYRATVGPVSTNTADSTSLSASTEIIPLKNRQVLHYAATQGPRISPTYEKAVCTEYVIAVLSHFTLLTKEEKRRIRIITTESITDLRKQHSPIIQGVCYALTASRKGERINSLSKVKPGDFMQYWNTFLDFDSGHCGIVKSLDLKQNTVTLYSSHPSTGGFGIQTFPMPDEYYFVRLK